MMIFSTDTLVAKAYRRCRISAKDFIRLDRDVRQTFVLVEPSDAPSGIRFYASVVQVLEINDFEAVGISKIEDRTLLNVKHMELVDIQHASRGSIWKITDMYSLVRPDEVLSVVNFQHFCGFAQQCGIRSVRSTRRKEGQVFENVEDNVWSHDYSNNLFICNAFAVHNE